MSFFARLATAVRGSSVRGIDEHPAWLLRCLLRARIQKNGDGTLLLTIDADDSVGTHQTFARLRPRLVAADGREIPLRVLEHTRMAGFPVRCVARSADDVAFDATGRVSVTALRLSFGGTTKDLEVTNAKEGS